jgi:hypothetical protein
MLKRAVAKLAIDIQRPVYYLISEYALLEARGSFFRPPCPGMLAWCASSRIPHSSRALRSQFRHGLDLSQCLYITTQSSAKLLAIPNAAGVTHISAASFFAPSGWTVASKMCERLTTPN